MALFFKRSDYPINMVDQVVSKVLKLERNIQYKKHIDDNESMFCVPWVTTFGPGFGELKEYVFKINKVLKNSILFSDQQTPVLGVISRRAPSIKDMLFSQKSVSLNQSPLGRTTTRCTPNGTIKAGRPCESCSMMSETDTIHFNNKLFHCSGGTCIDNNLIYGAQCQLCTKLYVGKTIQTFRSRISQHRNFMNKLGTGIVELDDENCLAAHVLFEHGLTSKNDFNSTYRFSILRYVANPAFITTEEQNLINFFNTLRPKGLNTDNPISLGINYLRI